MTLPAFEERRVPVGEAEYLVAEAGVGRAVLLLHGFPQTHACWHRVAPRLATSQRVIAVDLRGYGASSAPVGGPEGEGYSKRAMAAELVELMDALGVDRFAVVGHDRGARVAFRLALDHPAAVDRAAVLNVVPTIEQFERMGKAVSLGYWPWLLLAQPAPLPERLLGSDPQALLDHAFGTWASDPTAIDADRRAAYLAAMTPETIAAMCADYRASFHLDCSHDAADRAAGRRVKVPVLAVTGADERQLADAPAIWSAWAEDVKATTVPGGHFLPEEAPEALGDLLEAFLAEASPTP